MEQEVKLQVPCDIIILGGQSNAYGFGCGEMEEEMSCLKNVYLVYDDQPETFVTDERGTDILTVKRPWNFKVKGVVDKEYGAVIPLKFANEYIKNGLLDEGRNLVIIRAAVGGTGFYKKHWGIGEILYDRMLDMTEYILKQNKDNRVVAFLWHQGEHDAFENPEESRMERKKRYYTSLKTLVEEVRTWCKIPNLPFLCGGFTDEWSKDYREQCDAVIEATKDVCNDVEYAAYAETEGLVSNNQKVGNGDTIHFCKSALVTIGDRYFNNFRRIIDEN